MKLNHINRMSRLSAVGLLVVALASASPLDAQGDHERWYTDLQEIEPTCVNRLNHRDPPSGFPRRGWALAADEINIGLWIVGDGDALEGKCSLWWPRPENPKGSVVRRIVAELGTCTEIETCDRHEGCAISVLSGRPWSTILRDLEAAHALRINDPENRSSIIHLGAASGPLIETWSDQISFIGVCASTRCSGAVGREDIQQLVSLVMEACAGQPSHRLRMAVGIQ